MNTTTSTRKRTHLKSNQVTILQESFNTNPLPDATVRNRLARDLEVTERTIQIWFQNRRAKARKTDIAGNTFTTNTNPITRSNWSENSNRQVTPPRYQATFRTMMTPEIFEELKQDQHQQQHIRKRPRSSSKPEPKSAHLLLMNMNNNRAASEGLHRESILSNDAIFNTSLGQSSTYTPMEMVQLPVNVLRIGSWTRFTHATPQTHIREWDLVCFSRPIDSEFIWKVQAEGHHFRIQVPYHSINQISLSQQVQLDTGELVGQLEMDINLPLTFSMWRSDQDNQWVRCGDFTEDKQASMDHIHLLQGNHDAFKRCLLDLIALAPELASKIRVISSSLLNLAQPPLSPNMDLGRDYTISPTATPEPTNYIPQVMYNGNNHNNDNVNNNEVQNMINHPPPLSKFTMSHLMLQAPYYYSSSENQELYQQWMLQQQQQPMMYSYNNINTSLLM